MYASDIEVEKRWNIIPPLSGTVVEHVVGCNKTISSSTAFHICAGSGLQDNSLTKYSFLCPNGTLFQQQYFVCDWWFNVDCDKTEHFYPLNDELDTARQSSSHSTTQNINKVKESIPSFLDCDCDCR